MTRKNKKNTDRLKSIKDYYPIINPNEIEDETNVSIPSELDKKRAKKWVDDTQK